ncbi:MAG: DUF3850 domain-containing protein, partial [Dehalococcoidales bacterium]|nr:DUF3850 domain-containing protein [Dehalococcoidales bacterium]
CKDDPKQLPVSAKATIARMAKDTGKLKTVVKLTGIPMKILRAWVGAYCRKPKETRLRTTKVLTNRTAISAITKPAAVDPGEVETERDIKIHTLKTWPEYFALIQAKRKLFDWRRNDRGFHSGDLLFLKEFQPENQTYTGRTQMVRVDDVLDDPRIGIPEGYAILTITPVKLEVA